VRRRNAVREDVDLRDDYEDCEDEGEGVGGLGGCVVGCGWVGGWYREGLEKVKDRGKWEQLYCSWEFRQEWE